MAKVTLVGAKGQLGQYLCASLAEHEVLKVSRDEVDLTDLTALRTFLQQHPSDILINASAYTAVDKAESEPDLAALVNRDAPRTMAEVAAEQAIPFVHFSTDYVFSGDACTPYTEQAVTAPQGVYGETKLAGEQAVLACGGGAFIFRTAWVYSQRGHNFFKTMLRLAENHTSLRVVDDQIGSPTYAGTIAGVTANIVDQVLSMNSEQRQTVSGIYHLTSQGQCSWADFAQAIFSQHSQAVKVEPIPSSEYPTPAARPAFSVLNTSKLTRTFNLVLPEWQDGLKSCVAESK